MTPLLPSRHVKIALLYPPPWKIAEPGESVDPRDGPPPGYQPGDLDGDFYQTPYGLFALGAAAIAAGHQVKVINLSAYSWSRLESVVAALEADLFGLSCWTANRRGVALTAELIKQHHPTSHVVVGGPHASPLAKEMLQHHRHIDTVTVGESDLTFLELAERLEDGRAALESANRFAKKGKRREYTSYTLEERTDERIVSRLYEMCDVLHVKGEDYRYDKLS